MTSLTTKRRRAALVLREAGTTSLLAAITTAHAMQFTLTGPDGIGEALLRALDRAGKERRAA